jgi:tetratricopeptide (TPR) repeat protein
MTAPHHRGALEALHTARPAIARLGASQGPEDRAADLIEGWSAVETALRSLVGGSAHTGQALIRELRSRQLLTFDQGNALAEFHSASERARQVDYAPTDADINAAREGFLKLEAGMMSATAGEPAPLGGSDAYAGALAAASAPGVVRGSTASHRDAPVIGAGATTDAAAVFAPPPASRKWVRGLVGALALLILLAIGWWAYMRYGGGSELDQAVALYSRGQRQEAAAAFERAARDNPRDARPRIYLARMAREAGNLTLARDEATKAVTADPANSLAHGEMARYLMAAGNWDLARQFWLRALQANASDKAAQGYLGCTMVRLGRFDDARRWLERAGAGDWSVCAQQIPPAGAPGMYPPGAMPPGQMPPGSIPQQQQYPPGTVQRTP